MASVTRRGYLHEAYRLFHSTDRMDMDFQSHSHDFHKIVLCLEGHVTYIMEGTTYSLRPWDILIIPEHQIHRSILHAAQAYERIILWIQDSFLRSFSEPMLRYAFEWPLLQGRGLFRPDEKNRSELIETLLNVERNQKASFAGHALLADTYLLQFLLALGRLLEHDHAALGNAVRSDPKFNGILGYINGHLDEELSIDALSRRFYISTSYLMHEFKRHAGCTVHQYVQQKRLTEAAARIRAGDAVLAASQAAGFSDYSAFLKAFRKQYGCVPSALRGKAVPMPDGR